MTLYFLNSDTNKVNFWLDGDFRGVSLPYFPNGYQNYRLELTSRYTNRDIDADNPNWVYDCTLVSANERYSSFDINFANAAPTANQFKSGQYDLKLWGTHLDNPSDTFDPDQWVGLVEMEAKVVTKTTNNMARESVDANTTVKYKTEPNTAKSYVIYNS